MPLIIPIFTPRNESNIEENKLGENIISKKPNELSKIFEEFFIIGSKLENHIQGIVQPTNLFRYPNLASNATWYIYKLLLVKKEEV